MPTVSLNRRIRSAMRSNYSALSILPRLTARFACFAHSLRYMFARRRYATSIRSRSRSETLTGICAPAVECRSGARKAILDNWMSVEKSGRAGSRRRRDRDRATERHRCGSCF